MQSDRSTSTVTLGDRTDGGGCCSKRNGLITTNNDVTTAQLSPDHNNAWIVTLVKATSILQKYCSFATLVKAALRGLVKVGGEY